MTPSEIRGAAAVFAPWNASGTSSVTAHVAAIVERADRTYEMHSTWTGQDFGKQKPSEVFRDHFLTCFISDPVGVAMREKIGIDNICWEADYPHSDSMWPGAPEQLDEVLKANNVPDHEINKMTYENAMRWYHWDPFTHITKDQATVAPYAKPPKATTSPSTLSPITRRARAETRCTRRRGGTPAGTSR